MWILWIIPLNRLLCPICGGRVDDALPIFRRTKWVCKNSCVDRFWIHWGVNIYLFTLFHIWREMNRVSHIWDRFFSLSWNKWAIVHSWIELSTIFHELSTGRVPYFTCDRFWLPPDMVHTSDSQFANWLSLVSYDLRSLRRDSENKGGMRRTPPLFSDLPNSVA